MKTIGTSILVTSLNDAKGEKLAVKLADFLGLHYADAKSLVEYDLFDSNAIKLKCGIEYLRKREREALSGILKYENSLIYVSFNLFKTHFALVKSVRPIIYLNFPLASLSSKNELNKIAFADRNCYLAKKADLTVEVESVKDVNKVIEVIKEKI